MTSTKSAAGTSLLVMLVLAVFLVACGTAPPEISKEKIKSSNPPADDVRGVRVEEGLSEPEPSATLLPVAEREAVAAPLSSETPGSEQRFFAAGTPVPILKVEPTSTPIQPTPTPLIQLLAGTYAFGERESGYSGRVWIAAVEIKEDSFRVHLRIKPGIDFYETQLPSELCSGGQRTYVTDNLDNRYVAEECGGDFADNAMLQAGPVYEGYVEYTGRPVVGAWKFAYFTWFRSYIHFTLSERWGGTVVRR